MGDWNIFMQTNVMLKDTYELMIKLHKAYVRGYKNISLVRGYL